MESFSFNDHGENSFHPSNTERNRWAENSVANLAELDIAQVQLRDGIRGDIEKFGEDAGYLMEIKSTPHYYVDGVPVGKITELRVADDERFEDFVPEYIEPFKFARSRAYKGLRESAILENDFNFFIDYAKSSPDPYFAKTIMSEIKAKKETYPDWVVGDVEEVRSNIDFENQEIDRFHSALRRHSLKEIDKIKQARVANSRSRIFGALIEELRPDRLREFIHGYIFLRLERASKKPVIEQQILDEELARVGLERHFKSRLD